MIVVAAEPVESVVVQEVYGVVHGVCGGSDGNGRENGGVGE